MIKFKCINFAFWILAIVKCIRSQILLIYLFSVYFQIITPSLKIQIVDYLQNKKWK